MAKETTSYHFSSNPQGNDLVTDHVKKISQFIEDKLGEGLSALVLAGSFGRGEGSVYQHDDGRVEPINDYDFLIVLASFAPAIARETLAEWELECSGITGMRWIDFSALSESRLSKLPLTQANYDLKFGGQVVAGREDILDAIPEYRSEELPLKEAQVLLTTRFWCFIGIKPQAILNGEGGATSDDQRFVLQQLSKALIASGDSLLMLNGQYRVKYAEKALRVADVSGLQDVEHRLFEWGYAYKLGSARGLPDGYELRPLFVEALNIHLNSWNRIRMLTPFYKSIVFVRLIGGVRQLIRRLSLGGLKRVLLDRIQLRLLRWICDKHNAPHVSFVLSLLLWIRCGKWISELSSYAQKVANLRVGL